MAKLLVHESAGIREFEIIDNEVHMGRELDNTLRLPDPSISRHHCVIRKVGGGFEIQDLQSSNGVLVNGNRVQASPLRDGDRITLGQVQLTFQDPRPEVAATVAISAMEAPPPSGTVRMSADQLAAIHAGKAPLEDEPKIQIQNQVATGPVPSAPGPFRQWRRRPRPEPIAPPATSGPMPAFLAAYLPPIPDDAQPTGERGDFLTRFVAVLLDVVPLIGLYIVAFVLAFVPLVGCLVFPLIGLLGFAYTFLFIPYCESHFGGSFGKKIMKLRIVPEDDPNGRIDLGTAILRQVGHILNFTVGYLPGPRRRSTRHVGDMISKSVCIKVDR
ncbi:MAG: FHA domain-containing protein [Holophagaceae bacterium]|uniref:FHA domain-containing protein n=1 Tax=Candidatus Geothrix odensensis TaxID=2954440 RepID=A0A936F270_9BACT|nr:FHA domain-containing protein [Candidatus Geothrix odensensis]